MIELYRSGTKILSVRPAPSDKVTKKVNGENTLTLSVERSSPFAFAVGDYLFFQGERYTLNIVPKLKKTASNKFEYNLLFEGVEYELRKIQHLFYTANLEFSGGSDFSLMGDAELQARVIVENLNRVQSGWTLGNIIESTVKNLTFTSNNCLEAITKIAEEFETEFWIGSDKTINIEKRGDILPVTFEYGKGKGLYAIERDNINSKDIITRLYPFGSNSNLPKGYRSNAKRLKISTDYIERNVATYSIIESSEIFEDIKPERTGTITSVGDIFTFSDSSMDFDLNETLNGNTLYLIPGTTAKIHFQTGDLAGYEFELSSYVHATKTFKVNKFTDEVAYDLPNNTLKPRIGDKYIILDIYMPQSYVDAAEVRLLAKAQQSLNQNSEPNVAYKVAIDPLFIKNLGLTFHAGDYVSVVDSQLVIDRDIRIVSLSRSLSKLHEYTFDLADTVEPSLTSQIITILENQDTVIRLNNLKDPARARRNFKVVQELQNAIFDQDGYFEPTNIKPLSIETSMLTVGAKQTQFDLDCYFEANYGGNKNTINIGNGTLNHLTIEKSWTITGLSETFIDDNLRYIYATCFKSGTTGQIVASVTKKAIEEGNYYNFLVGILSSVISDARQFSLVFGFSSVNGRFIKTGRIVSGAGADKFIDIDTGEIRGVFKFSSGDRVSHVFNAEPTTPYYIGDLWNGGSSGDYKRCKTERLTGSYTAADWELATSYDKTQTIIDGGIITTGSILLGIGSTIKAGITGYGTAENDIRIWAGGTFANRATANFRVRQDGKVISRSSYDLEDTSGNVLAGLVGGGTGVALRFWAGGTQGNESTMPFKVYSDGSAVIQKATLQSGTSGRRIVISSADGDIRMFRADNEEILYISEAPYDYLSFPEIRLHKPAVENSNYIEQLYLNPRYLKIVNEFGAGSFLTSSGAIYCHGAGSGLFQVVPSGNFLDLLLSGLPTSTAGLGSGKVYQSGGFLKIIP